MLTIKCLLTRVFLCVQTHTPEHFTHEAIPVCIQTHKLAVTEVLDTASTQDWTATCPEHPNTQVWTSRHTSLDILSHQFGHLDTQVWTSRHTSLDIHTHKLGHPDTRTWTVRHTSVDIQTHKFGHLHTLFIVVNLNKHASLNNHTHFLTIEHLDRTVWTS